MATLWTERESAASALLTRLALQEDLAGEGDATSEAIIPEALWGQAAFVARANGVLAGLPIVPFVFAALSPEIEVRGRIQDGAFVQAGERLALMTGPMRGLLTGERTALNFLQR